MARVARRVEHGDEAAQGVSIHDRPRDAKGVAEVADAVSTKLKAPARRIDPLGATMPGQVEIDDLRGGREPRESGLK
jgi:hypothetical protein